MEHLNSFKWYLIPIGIGLLTAWIGLRVQYWYDGIFNDRILLHKIVQMINDGQIEVHKK